MEPVRWGVLSTSDFAERKFLPGIVKSPMVQVAAVGSRNLSAARAFADRTGIETAYGSYEDLLADPNIEVIYNPLPNHLHVEWTKRAAEAGKHVLCEKPMGMTADEVESLLPYAAKVHIAEAFMVRFHPQWLRTRELIRSGELGRIVNMHVLFSYFNDDASNIRNVAAAGGGALYDIGCYAIVAARWFFDADPVRVAAVVDRDPNFGTDRLTSALLDFGDGRTCNFSVSTQSVFHQRVHVFGTKGRLEVTLPFNQFQDAPMHFFTHFGTTADGSDLTREDVATADQYELQATAFCERVRNEAPSTAHLEDAITNLRVIDAVFRSAESGRFVPIV
jgi:predicted dehydrogenase